MHTSSTGTFNCLQGMKHNLPVDDIIEWDILNWSQLIPFWLPLLENIPRDASVLAIGERNGGLSLMMALLGFHVTCTDRTSPSAKATILHEKHKVSGLVKIAGLDIVNGAIADETYDIILAKSVIGGLKRDPSDKTTRSFEVQKKAVDNIHRLLKPGGYFLSAENMRGAWLTQQFRKWKGKETGWRYLDITELGELYARFPQIHIHSFGILPTTFSNIVINHFNFWVNKYLLDTLPAKYKYISFVSAKKQEI